MKRRKVGQRITWRGLPITIENPKGSRRKKGWARLAADYGEIAGTVGADADPVDVFVGPTPESDLVVVIDQVNRDRSFDEHKVLVGFASERDAVKAYRRSYSRGWIVGPVTTMTVDQFKQWLRKGSQQRRIASQVSKYAATATFAAAVEHYDTQLGLPMSTDVSPKPPAKVDTPKPAKEPPKPSPLAEGTTHNAKPGTRLGSQVGHQLVAPIYGGEKQGGQDLHLVVDEPHDHESIVGRKMVWLKDSDGRKHVRMPVESVAHYHDDLHGKVDSADHAHPAIAAVGQGKAEFLGKGDDGLAFRHGEHVVKVGTTVPYHPTAADYHRTPDEARARMRKSNELHRQIVEAGFGDLVVPQQYFEHGEKGITVMPHVDTDATYTKEQLDNFANRLRAFHDAGYRVGDTLQTGLASDGTIRLFDLGKARTTDRDDDYQLQDEQSYLRGMYRDVNVYDHHSADEAYRKRLAVTDQELGFEVRLQADGDVDAKRAGYNLRKLHEAYRDMVANDHDALSFIGEDHFPRMMIGEILGAEMPDNWKDDLSEFAKREGIDAGELIDRGVDELVAQQPALEPPVRAHQYKLHGTRAPAFKAWFGDWESGDGNHSKVIDANTGLPAEQHEIQEPMRMYHGTSSGDFQQFEPRWGQQTTGYDADMLLYGPGFYFTDDEKTATSYSKMNERQSDVFETEADEEQLASLMDVVGQVADAEYEQYRKAGMALSGKMYRQTAESAREFADIFRTIGFANEQEKDAYLQRVHSLEQIAASIVYDAKNTQAEAFDSEGRSNGTIYPTGAESLVPALQKGGGVVKRTIVTNAKVMEVYLNIRKPFDGDNDRLGSEFFEWAGLGDYYSEAMRDNLAGYRSELASQQSDLTLFNGLMEQAAADLKTKYDLDALAHPESMIREMVANGTVDKEAEQLAYRWSASRNNIKLTEENIARLEKAIDERGKSGMTYVEAAHLAGGKEKLNTLLKNIGYDGITHIGGRIQGSRDHRVYIAFDPSQIKAVDNRGTFDSEDPRMRYAGNQAQPAKEQPDYGHSTATEGGREFRTGQPIEFPFMRNKEPAPPAPPHDPYQQTIEPAGRYLTHDAHGTAPQGWETGKVAFSNPLVVRHSDEQGGGYGPTSWKARLSAAAGGKTGDALARHIAELGHDGIITTKGDKETSEIVDLTHHFKDKYAAPHQMTKAEYNEQVQQIKPLPNAVLNVGKTMVIRNPSDDDHRFLAAQVRQRFPNMPKGESPIRFTNDQKGNRYVWKAHEGMHADIEPHLQKLTGESLSQNHSIPRHQDHVKKAIREGVTVPKRVQADYPQYADYFSAVRYAEMVDYYATQLGLFDEQSHPREPKGSSKGGQFTKAKKQFASTSESKPFSRITGRNIAVDKKVAAEAIAAVEKHFGNLDLSEWKLSIVAQVNRTGKNKNAMGAVYSKEVTMKKIGSKGPFADTFSEEDFFRTLVHELVHVAQHQTGMSEGVGDQTKWLGKPDWGEYHYRAHEIHARRASDYIVGERQLAAGELTQEKFDRYFPAKFLDPYRALEQSEKKNASKQLADQNAAVSFAEMVDYYATQLGLFDEESHPREPKGSSKGGQFTKAKPGTGPGGLTRTEAIAKASEGSAAKLLTYAQRVRATMLYLGDPDGEWNAVKVTGMTETTDDRGTSTSVPVFEMPKGYKQAETPWSGDDSCSLCGARIKNHYHIQNDKNKLTMNVGSECVQKYTPAGETGEKQAKKSIAAATRETISRLEEAKNLLWNAGTYQAQHRDPSGVTYDKTKWATHKAHGKAAKQLSEEITELLRHGKEAVTASKTYNYKTQENDLPRDSDRRLMNWSKGKGTQPADLLAKVTQFLKENRDQAKENVRKAIDRFSAVDRYAADQEFSSVDEVKTHLDEKHGKALTHLAVSEGDDHIQLDNVRVAPASQSKGVGSDVVSKLKGHANKTGKPIVLSAEADKGKKSHLERFYKRHGFQRPKSKDHSLPRHTHIYHPVTNRDQNAAITFAEMVDYYAGVQLDMFGEQPSKSEITRRSKSQQRIEWNEAEHPRVKKGSKGGGQFAKRDRTKPSSRTMTEAERRKVKDEADLRKDTPGNYLVGDPVQLPKPIYGGLVYGFDKAKGTVVVGISRGKGKQRKTVEYTPEQLDEHWRQAMKPGVLSEAMKHRKAGTETKSPSKQNADGVKMVQAPKGGAISEVTGKFYKGGQWMPVHGAHSGKPKPEPKPPKTAGGEPPVAGETEGSRGSRGPRRQQTAEEIAAKKAADLSFGIFDRLRNKDIGKLMWMADRKIAVGRNMDKFTEHAATMSNEQLARLADAAKEIDFVRTLAQEGATKGDGTEEEVREHWEWREENEATNDWFLKRAQKKLLKEKPDFLRAWFWLDSATFDRSGNDLARDLLKMQKAIEDSDTEPEQNAALSFSEMVDYYNTQRNLPGWRTIGAEKSNPPGEQGGTPVYMDMAGNIAAGPAKMVGHHVDAIGGKKEAPQYQPGQRFADAVNRFRSLQSERRMTPSEETQIDDLDKQFSEGKISRDEYREGKKQALADLDEHNKQSRQLKERRKSKRAVASFEENKNKKPHELTLTEFIDREAVKSAKSREADVKKFGEKLRQLQKTDFYDAAYDDLAKEITSMRGYGAMAARVMDDRAADPINVASILLSQAEQPANRYGLTGDDFATWKHAQKHEAAIRKRLKTGLYIDPAILSHYRHYNWFPAEKFDGTARDAAVVNESEKRKSNTYRLRARDGRRLAEQAKQMVEPGRQAFIERFEAAKESEIARGGLLRGDAAEKQTGLPKIYEQLKAAERGTAEYAQLHDQFMKARQEFGEAAKKAQSHRDERGHNVAMMAAKDVANQAGTSGNGNALNTSSDLSQMQEKTKVKIDKAVEFVNAILPASLATEFKVEIHDDPIREHAKADTVHIHANTSVATIVHELGHVIEHAKREGGRKLGEVSKNFLCGCVVREKVEHLGDFYNAGEVASKDGLITNYAGKDYIHLESTEILSMGLQALYENAGYFAENAPRHYQFTVASLGGKLQ